MRIPSGLALVLAVLLALPGCIEPLPAVPGASAPDGSVILPLPPLVIDREDAGVEGPAPVPDAGRPDAGTADAGAPDAGSVDAGPVDAGALDAGALDAGSADAGAADAGSQGPAPDAGVPDAGGPAWQSIRIDGQPYRAYSRSGDTFRVVCADPCPLAVDYLEARYDGFAAVKGELVALAGMDVLPELAPVDLHLATDSVCGAPGASISGMAILPWSGSGYTNAQVCLWDLEASQRPPPYVPRPLTPAAARSLDAQMLPAHEYAHTILFRRHELSYEWVVRALSYRLTHFITDLCDPRLITYSARPAYELCQRNGLDWDDFTAAFSTLDALYQAGGGLEVALYEGLPTTSTTQLQQVLGDRLGGSTYAACVAGGELRPNQCGDTAELPVGAATVSMYGGLITWQLPEGALMAPVTVRPGSWRHGMFVAPEWDDFHWVHNYDFLPEEVRFQVPVRLSVRYDPALIPAGGSEASLALYERQPLSYTLVPGSEVDTATHRVSANVSKLGRYIVAPR